MKKTAIASLLVGLMALPALARDDYRMDLGAAAPRHDNALGAIHHEGGAVSLDYSDQSDGVTGLSGQYGAKEWGAGLQIPDTSADPMVMNLFGGYSFGDFEVGLHYMNTDPDASTILAARYLGGAWNAGLLVMDYQGFSMNVLGFSYDMNDVTVALDVNMPEVGDTNFDLGVGYYQDWFVGLLLSDLSDTSGNGMVTALEAGYGMDNWHASLKYTLDATAPAETMALHASFMF